MTSGGGGRPIDLVTGGAGFVGSRLVSTLRASGRRVRILDTTPRHQTSSKNTPHDRGNRGSDEPIEYLCGSICDKGAAEKACLDVDTVYHLAGIADLWRRDQSDFDTVNNQGTRTMLAAARKAGAKTFVHCSSATTLIGNTIPIGPSTLDERSTVAFDDALGAYPLSKLKAEAAALEASAGFGKQHDMRVVIVNPTEPLGAGDKSLTPPTKMILDFVNGKTPASLDCVLNFVSLDDLARGFVAAAEKGANGDRYLLAGQNVPMAELLSMVSRLTGIAMPKARLPYGLALLIGFIDTNIVAGVTGKPPKAPLTGVRLAGRRVTFDASKAARDLDWLAAPFEPALKEMLDWARQSGLASF